MYLSIAAILIVGFVVVVIFAATLSYLYSRQVNRTYAEIQKQFHGKVTASDDLTRTTLSSLAEGNEPRSVIDKWQKQRSETLPEKGWDWKLEDLESWRRNQLAKFKQQLTSRLMFRGVVGIAVLFLIFGGASVGVYAIFARRGPDLPTATPSSRINDQSYLPSPDFDFTDQAPPNAAPPSLPNEVPTFQSFDPTPPPTPITNAHDDSQIPTIE